MVVLNFYGSIKSAICISDKLKLYISNFNSDNTPDWISGWKGELEEVYNPQLTNGHYDIEESDKTWWTKVTEFPIEADITIQGLLRPAILMEYVKVNVWFYGRKHLSSGYYLITGETDEINQNGYHTTLSLIRVAADEEYI